VQSKFLITIIFCFVFCFSALAQEDKEKNNTADELIIETSGQTREPIDPLSPARAAFYSAILPGLGQAYNKKYWKIPIIYAALGTSIYFYIDNNNEYNRYRDAYKRRLAGFEDDEFYDSVTTDRLIDAQDTLRRNKELSLLITFGFYVLNIIEANVNAHLLQYNIDNNLSLQPHYKIDEFDNSSSLGLTLNFKF